MCNIFFYQYLFIVLLILFSVDAKAEIGNLQNQIKSLEEKNAVLEKTNQNVRYIYMFVFL